MARFGGDEFALIDADIESLRMLPGWRKKYLMPQQVILIQGSEIRTGASIGIAVYGPDAPDAETLLSQADLALYRAKAEGRGTYRFFTEAMDREVRIAGEDLL